MPFITLNGGLTLKVPTRGTEDWDPEFLNDFATPISNHTHTGSGDGNQLGSGSLVDNAVSDLKMRLRNNEYFRGRNFTGSADINILKVKADDTIEYPTAGQHLAAETFDAAVTMNANSKMKEISSLDVISLTNNQASFADVPGITLDTANDKGMVIEYTLERLGTANLTEKGLLEITYKDSTFNIVREFSRDDAGISFQFTAGGQLQYTLSDNAGSTSEKLHITLLRLGD